MNLDKLKEAARKFEQREDWRRAIDVYIQAIREAEAASGETTQDPGLYNRLGDLQLKAGDLLPALRAYEEAAELYADQGFFNNAIALCGKILRINPNRVPTYLRLAQLHARKNFAGETRKNLAEYLARMSGPRQRAEAFGAVELFAEHFSGNPEIRAMLVDLLRAFSADDESGGEDPDFARLAARLEGNEGAASRLVTDGPSLRPERGAGAEHLGRGVAFHNDLIFIDTGLSGLSAGGPEEIEPHGAASLDARVAARESAVYHQDAPEGPDFEILPEDVRSADLITADSAGPRRAALAEDAAAVLPVPPTDVAPLEAALRHLEMENRWDEALEVAAELIQLDPGSVARYQKRVELAYFAGQRSVLIGAYLDLAGALRSRGRTDQTAQVYRRVLVHDPDNRVALSGLAGLTAPPPISPDAGATSQPAALPPLAPSPPAEPEDSGFVDLGALILDENPAGNLGDSRIRISEKPLDEDEDRVFREALAEFKRGVESHLDPEDFQSHYDLGIAFKEMGLMDEAIAQFQKALRAREGNLRAAEQLGIAFYEQGQYGIAEAVLRRAHGLVGSDDEKIGILYWYGRALEAQGKNAEALPLYEQAVALDIRFLDVRERAQRLAAERGR